MFEKPLVLDCDEGILHRLRNLIVALEELALLIMKVVQKLAVSGVDLGHAVGLMSFELIDVRQVVREQVVYYNQTCTVREQAEHAKQCGFFEHRLTSRESWTLGREGEGYMTRISRSSAWKSTNARGANMCVCRAKEAVSDG
jgi:hypothetical protein